MNVTGFSSPHKDDVIDTNDRCDPIKSSYVEFSDCGGAILDEQPAKLTEAIRLFLQGLGHSEFEPKKISIEFKQFLILVSHMSIAKFSIANRLTEQALENKRRNSALGRSGHRQSVPFDTADSGLYRKDSQEGEDPAEGFNDYENELQLRVDSFEDRNIKL